MTLQELINELFKDYPEPIDLSRTDIVEYMILEAVDSIHYIKGKDYTCKHWFFDGDWGYFSEEKTLWDPKDHVYGVLFREKDYKEKHSQLKYLKKRFVQKLGVEIIPDKYPDHQPDLTLEEGKTTVGFKLKPQWFEAAIRNSSLVKAAGDLTGLALVELIQLREDVNHFLMQDKTVNQLVVYLQSKIDTAIKQHPDFTQERLTVSSQEIQKLTELKRFYYEKEMEFNVILNELESSMKPLIYKGKQIIQRLVGVAESYPPQNYFETQDNPDFDEKYIPAKEAAKTLKKQLNDAGNRFFSQPNQDGFCKFKEACIQAIGQAEPTLAQFPGFKQTKALITTLETVVETTDDLSRWDWDALLKLKEKSSTGWMKNKTVIKIVDAHQKQIDQVIKQHPDNDYNKAEFSQLSERIQKSKEDKKFYYEKEKEFNSIFKQLQIKLDQLILKGSDRNKSDFNPKYVPAKQAAEALRKELEEARDSFFDKPDKGSLDQFKDKCVQAIQKAEPIFAQHRGYWQTHSIVTLFISILDTLVDLYAYALKKDSIQHYRDTFFSDNDSTQQLKSFKQKLLDGEQGLLEGLEPKQP